VPYTVEQALYKELVATAQVAALVGTRIYPQAAPQGTTADYIVYELVAAQVAHDHSGAGGWTDTRLSYLCHASTYGAAKAIATAVRAALDGRRGSFQGTTLQAVLLIDEADAGFDEVLQMHVVAVDFRVLY
jgi:hypothetical protein